MPIAKLRSMSRGMEALIQAGTGAELEMVSPPSAEILEGGEDYMVKTWYTGSTVFGIDQKGRKYVAKDGIWKKFRARKPIVIATKKLNVKTFLKASELYKSAHAQLEKAFTAGEIPDPKKLPWINDEEEVEMDDKGGKLQKVIAYIPVERDNE